MNDVINSNGSLLKRIFVVKITNRWMDLTEDKTCQGIDNNKSICSSTGTLEKIIFSVLEVAKNMNREFCPPT